MKTHRLLPSLLPGPLALAASLCLLAACGRTGLYGVDIPCEGAGCPDIGTIPGDGFIGDGMPRGDGFPPDGDMSDCHSRPEVCNNHVDDNCNGLVDCDDPQCLGNPTCPPPGLEVCNNGVDDDHNGFTDCDDPACAAFPGCQPHECDHNKPNCADPACVDEPACQNLVCKPGVDFGPLAHNDAHSEKMLSTTGTLDVEQSVCAPAPGGGQVVSTFEVLTDQTVVMLSFTQPPGADHVFALYRAGVNQRCTANAVDSPCYDPKAAPTGSHSWVLDQGHYYLMVIAATRPHQGSIDVVLETTKSQKKEVCNNGIDDDANGLTDCADPTCINDPSCAARQCKPDVNVGTVIPGQQDKFAHVDTSDGTMGLQVQCGGNGRTRTVQFSVAETVWMHNIVSQQGDHAMALYRLPPAGQQCNFDMIQCVYMRAEPQWNWVWDEEIGAGTYLILLQAMKPDSGGPIDISFSAVRPKRIELCHNNIDDDLNGLTDCADPACFDDGKCPPPLCVPDVDFGQLKIGDPPKQAKLDLHNGVPHELVTCAKGGGRSRIVQFNLPVHAGVVLGCTEQPNNPMTGIIGLFSEAPPRASCDQGTELACADPGISPFGCNWEWPGLQAGTYYVIVQAFQAGLEGTANLSLSAVQDLLPEICDNKIDDDGDGAVDCEDLKCVTSHICKKEACKADVSIDPMPIGGMMVVESVDSRNKPSVVNPSCAAAPGGGQVVVFVNLPQKANVKIDFAQPMFGANNHVIAIYPYAGPGLPCGAGNELLCQPSLGLASGSFSLPGVPAGKYWVVVAANKPGTEGPVILSFTAMP